MSMAPERSIVIFQNVYLFLKIVLTVEEATTRDRGGLLDPCPSHCSCFEMATHEYWVLTSDGRNKNKAFFEFLVSDLKTI